LRSEDAEALVAAANVRADYADVNPYTFAPAVSPNIAADAAGVVVQLATIQRRFERLSALSDVIVVEGAGGWLTPLSAQLTIADVAVALGLPVVLVVGMRLGCLNHAALTHAAISRSGVPWAGWVANCATGVMDRWEENIGVLTARLGAAPLAVLPFAPHATSAALAHELACKLT
jgi:dethiobiotin synthetase